MALITNTPTLRRAARAGRGLLAGIAAASITTIGVLVSAEEVGAKRVELAVNALAPEISSSAERAADALDAYLESGDADDRRTLAFHRATTARYVAAQLGYDEFEMIDAWSATSFTHQRALLAALSQVGVPYRTHTSEEGVGFDCSGMTIYAWSSAGVDIPRISGSQINQAEPVTRETARAGDLVHYPGHVMMYLGVDDAIVHAIQTGRTVEVDTISERRRNSVRWGDPTG